MNKSTLYFLALLLTSLFSYAQKKSVVIEKPNIIVIYTDDHGYADLGIQGQKSDVKTPNIDQLARDGVRMTSGYVTAPQCAPSRAGMLTRRYQQRYCVMA